MWRQTIGVEQTAIESAGQREIERLSRIVDLPHSLFPTRMFIDSLHVSENSLHRL